MTKLDAVKALKRQAVGPDSVFVLELRARTVTMRPLHARDVDATIEVTWESIYRRALERRVTR